MKNAGKAVMINIAPNSPVERGKDATSHVTQSLSASMQGFASR